MVGPLSTKKVSFGFLSIVFLLHFRPKSPFNYTRSITGVICWISKASPHQKTIQNTQRELHRENRLGNLLLIRRLAALKTLIASQITWAPTTLWSSWKCAQVLSLLLLVKEVTLC